MVSLEILDIMFTLVHSTLDLEHPLDQVVVGFYLGFELLQAVLGEFLAGYHT